MKRFKGTRGTICFILIIIIIIVAYFMLANRSIKEEGQTAILTQTKKVLLRDLEKNYPPSPKEVIKYYSEITKAFYDGDYTEEELEELALKAREMYDDELKATQTEEEYLLALQEDINHFKANDWTISSYSTSSSLDVEEFKEDGREYARIYCIYSVRKGSKVFPTNEVYILRKDQEGHYKILGWAPVEETDEG